MKDFRELTDQEQLDVVRFSTDNGVYFYSRIERLLPDVIVYEKIEYAIDYESYSRILNGMNRYEIYKLSMTVSEAQDIIRDQSMNILSEFYKSKSEAIIEQLQKHSDAIMRSIKSKDVEIDSARTSISDAIDNIIAIKDKLADSSDVLDMDNIIHEFRIKMDDVKSVKNEFITELAPVKQNVNDLVSSLREIVRPNRD